MNTIPIYLACSYGPDEHISVVPFFDKKRLEQLRETDIKELKQCLENQGKTVVIQRRGDDIIRVIAKDHDYTETYHFETKEIEIGMQGKSEPSQSRT